MLVGCSPVCFCFHYELKHVLQTLDVGTCNSLYMLLHIYATSQTGGIHSGLAHTFSEQQLLTKTRYSTDRMLTITKRVF